MKNILVTGGSGLLGSGLFFTKRPNDRVFFCYLNNKYFHEVYGDQFVKINLTNKENLESFIKKYSISHVVHAASIGNIDYCENNKAIAKKINIDSTKILFDLSVKYNFTISYISSNAIFDGTQAPYGEESIPSPQNYYGFTKLESEKIILANKKNSVIRLVLLYGWNNLGQRMNPMTWIIEELTKNNKLYLVNDIYNNPISNIEASNVIWSLLDKNFEGIIHVAGKDIVNRYDLGIKIAEVFKLNKELIESVTSDFFPYLTKRMPDTTYDISKLKKTISFKSQSLEESLNYLKNNKPIWIKN